MQYWVSLTKDIFQILFFIVAGTVTILTYLKAKRTLLQPIRTEIFKEQIKAFSQVLKFFTGKSETDLHNAHGFDDLVMVNVCALYDDFAYAFYDIRVDYEKRPYNHKDCPVSIISTELLVLADNFITVEKPNESGEEHSNDRYTKETWSSYQFDEIRIPRQFVEYNDEINSLTDSPLLTKELVALIKDYQDAVHNNTEILGEILTNCSQEMTEKYFNIEQYYKAAPAWIRAKYNAAFIHLEPKAKAINDYVRDYFASDKLFD